MRLCTPPARRRFHLPVGGTVLAIVDIPGELLTVNPIAVNSTFADVFTRHGRGCWRCSASAPGCVSHCLPGLQR